MKKEILTIERCRQDLAELLKIDYPNLLLPPIALGAIATALFIYSFYSADTVVSMFAAVLTIPFAVSLISALVSIIRLRRMRRCPFEIVEDQLYSVSEGRDMSNSDSCSVNERKELIRSYGYFRGSYTRAHIYILTFQNVGRYRISLRPHYRWSSLCSMNVREVYESSTPGDSFYIVLLKDGRCSKPMLVYNTKLFAFFESEPAHKPGESWRDSVSME